MKQYMKEYLFDFMKNVPVVKFIKVLKLPALLSCNIILCT